MPQLDLANLSGPELRRLLDASRARGEAPLSYSILQEMAARREVLDARKRSSKRRGPEPRVVAMNFGDLAEPEDDVPPMPNWRAPTPEPEAPAVAFAPDPAPKPSRRAKDKAPPAMTVPPAEATTKPAQPSKPPRGVWDDDPSPGEPSPAANDLDLRLRSPQPERPRSPRRLGGVPGAGFAAGIAVGVALGWWVGDIRNTPPAPGQRAPLTIETVALATAPAPAPLATATPQPEAAETSEPAAEAPPMEIAEGPQFSPDAEDAARDATTEAMEPPTPPVVAKASTADACAAQPTPADREICGDADLQRLQRELRQAYAEALDAHEDRDLLRQRQLAWRDARNTVSEPGRLAQLYEQRIRKLNSATAAARQER